MPLAFYRCNPSFLNVKSVLYNSDIEEFKQRAGNNNMKVIVAKTAGFCMGVKRAVDLAIENSTNATGGIKTLGPLIHNSQTLEMLRLRGVTVLDEKQNLNSGSTVMIRAHGVPPKTQSFYESRSNAIIDGTCPKVKTVHKVISKYREMGYQIVITGDQGHAEVIGLLGYAGKAGFLIDSLEDIGKIPEADKICLVSQTTFDRTLFDKIASGIKKRFQASEVVIKKTICAATDQRQAEVATLSKQVDALIVVGGKNSANTQRLARIAASCGTPTQLVESESEIDWDSIKDCNTVGVAAGASTPNWMIKQVSDYLQFKDRTSRHNIKNMIWNTLDTFANMNIFVALGAIAVYYASCTLQEVSFTFTGAGLAFLYFLSMYLWNNLASIESTQHHGISRYNFYRMHKKSLFWLSVISIFSLLLLSFQIKPVLFYLMLFASFAGSVYHVTIVPKKLRGILHYKKLKDIPTSRDLFVALAWATLLTIIPQAIDGSFQFRPTTVATFIWIFILAFFRSLIFDLRDIEGDRIMGRETLITVFGEKRARKAIHLMIWVCLISLMLFPAFIGPRAYQHQNTIRFFLQIPTLFYASTFIRWNPRLRHSRSALFNLLADGLFYIVAIGAWISSMIL